MKYLYSDETKRQKVELLECEKTSLIESIILDHALVNGLPATPDSVDQCVTKITNDPRLKMIESSLKELYQAAIPIGFNWDEKIA